MISILILSDGKPGHVNQSQGLAEALSRHTRSQINIIDLPQGSWWKKTRYASAQIRSLPHIDLIIAAGHRTHLPLLLLRKKIKARTVVMMKPSLPTRLFDLCLIPEHDLKHRSLKKNIITTVGALNRIVASTSKSQQGLILIGGPSREYSWHKTPLLEAMAEISNNRQLAWHLTDSRRTPSDFIESLSPFPIIVHPHQETTADWLPAQLQQSSEVWVTEDSVSMIFEALTSGAAVGLLPMKRIKAHGKIHQTIDQLIANKDITTYANWLTQRKLAPASTVLNEADRCAAIVMQRLFPHLL
jgi:uncharacterized protein